MLPGGERLRPLGGVLLQPLQVALLVERAEADDRLPLLALLVVLLHLLAVAELVLPPSHTSVQTIVSLQKLFDNLGVHQRFERLPVGGLPLVLLDLVDGALDVLQILLVYVSFWISLLYFPDLNLDLSWFVSRSPQSFQGILCPQF